MIKLCVMCNVELKEDETSVYSCKKCYKKYAFYTIEKKKRMLMKDNDNDIDNFIKNNIPVV